MPIKNGVVFHVNDGDAETVWTCRLSGKNELTFDQVRKYYNFQITRPKSEISLSVCSLESNLSNGVTFYFLRTSEDFKISFLEVDQVRLPYKLLFTEGKNEVFISVCSLESRLLNGATF